MSELVAVIIPMYKTKFSPLEKVSMRHARHFLKDFPIFLVTPHSLQVSQRDIEVITFKNAFFTSTTSYSKLLLCPDFYETFSNFKYILIYQLDCLVLSSQLKIWCHSDYDYLGAPWFNSSEDPSKGFSRVGNGGLSLRKVESFLKVMGATSYFKQPNRLWRNALMRLPDIEHWPLSQRLSKKLQILWKAKFGYESYCSRYTLNEDHFWSDRARVFDPDFKIAPVDTALRFAFERFPRYCLERNGRRLPFGAHAWSKWDRNFWEPYLLK